MLIRAFLRSTYAPWLTHLSLAALTLTLFGLILWTPWYVALVPGLLINHRIGILLHEYIHGIPFRMHRYNLWVMTLFEGLMVSFGLLELFRGTHLAHHRWLNTDRDPAVHSSKSTTELGTLRRMLLALEGSQHIVYLFGGLRGSYPIVKRSRILYGALLATVATILWIALGHWEVPVALIAFGVYNAMVSSSLRGAVEHHASPDEDGFANEYRALVPLFNINRHVHHHLDPKRPWYLLEWKTRSPLPAAEYWLRWFRVYVQRTHVLMQPMRAAVLVPQEEDGLG